MSPMCMEALHGLTHIHTFSSLLHHSLCFCSFQSLASPHMLTPISQMRRMRPRQAKELVEVTQTVSSREGIKRGLHVSCLLPAPHMLFLSHTCASLTPPPKLDFSPIFLLCVCSLVHVWGQGFLCQGELVVRCESPELGSETHLCSVAVPAPITVW